MLANLKTSSFSTEVDLVALLTSSYTGDSSIFWTGNEGDPEIVSPHPGLSTNSEAVTHRRVEIR
jgi:hypothetical protein